MLTQIQKELLSFAKLSPEQLRIKAKFFKSQKGEYAEGDQFIGVKNPDIQKVAKKYKDIDLGEVQNLIESPINEERLLALYILCAQYKKGSKAQKDNIFHFYLKSLSFINNWNLVDASAHHIIGAHLFKSDKTLLKELAKSDNLWKRRAAVVATLYFIRQNEFEWVIKLCKILLKDSHDLIHKATGWMLREAGKKNIQVLLDFLDEHGHEMPRTMLRYSIEKLDEKTKKHYMQLKNQLK